MKQQIQKLSSQFYLRPDVVQIAKDLLGKFLVTNIENENCSGMITEVEVYAGEKDKASHAFGGRRTTRTEIMYATGGVAYVYLCYGIHHLFNVVTNKEDIPHAILIRAIEPVEGIEMMLLRRQKKTVTSSLTSGPGAMSQAMGIKISDTGISLSGIRISIEDRGIRIASEKILSSQRIGVDYAGKDARLNNRFTIIGNPFVSKP